MAPGSYVFKIIAGIVSIIVLIKHLLIFLYSLLFSRQLLRLRKPWNQLIVLCIFILMVTNIAVFNKGCRSTFLTGEPVVPGRQKHGHVMTFPEHHFVKEPFNKNANPIAESLMPFAVPLTVHFVWCNEGYFQFQNYLSVLSAYKFLHPMEIIFHYSSEPELDSVAYYQFYQDILRDVPVFFPKRLEDARCCSNSDSDKLTHIARLLDKYGGIYIDVNTLLSQDLLPLRKNRFVHFVQMSYEKERENVLLMLMRRNHMMSAGQSIKDAMSGSSVTPSCCTSSSYTTSSGRSVCVHVDQELFPADIFDLQTDFGQLARWISYGTKSILIPQPHEMTVVPNIVHYVWLGNRVFSFFSYMNLLSTLYIFKADTVYIHGDQYPKGEYWDKVKDDHRVKFVFREVPSTVFGNFIGAHLSHASDFLRTDVLLRYGGVYMDWDALWVNTIPESLRKYDFVACPDWPRTGNYPAVFNMGIISARKQSVFLQYFLESFRHYIDSSWGYNAIHMPYKVYEKHPSHLLVYRHLQVICFNSRCHPVWVNGYKDEEVNHLTTAPFDWRNDTLVVHWTSPDPVEFESQKILEASHGMYSDIGKFVLEKAGLR